MKYYRFLVLTAVLLTGCYADPDVDTLPPSYVNEFVYLSNIENLPLKQPNGFVYITGGIKGIVLLNRNNGSYSAFERNCTHEHENPNAIISVDSQSGFYFVCKHCQSTFDFDGKPTSGPARYSLRRYDVGFSGVDVLHISGGN